MSGDSPSFDLVLATLGRTEELARFLESVDAQDFPRIRVLVVDQNQDDRIEPFLSNRTFEIVRLRSEPGLSRARNIALVHLSADVVAFPDDDCVYPPHLLRTVADRLEADAALDGLTGRAADAAGRSSASWEAHAATLTPANLWNRGISFAIFLRGALVRRIGSFDERLGLGSSEPWSSGEEIDYLVRAVRADARIVYDPALVVHHEVREDSVAIGYRDGASVGYLLRKHGYPVRTRSRMLVRPVGGALVALARGDRARAAYYAATVRGRVHGYRGARPSKSSE